MTFFKNTNRIHLADEEWISIEGGDYLLGPLEGARGGNSCVFQALHPEDDSSYVVKICRYPIGEKYFSKRVDRFRREIAALRLASGSPQAESVIKIVEDGQLVVESGKGSGGVELLYYVMEKADSNLSTYLQTTPLQLPEKIKLCNDLLKVLEGLHALDIYHRDIKPANILMRGGYPLFGDLGLAAFRGQDQDLDDIDEKIGPIGYLSPEATNKCLALRGQPSFKFDCGIDEKSDIFQLGQVFWLIVQDEVPTGHLSSEDLSNPSYEGFLDGVIRPMLQYGKQRRASLAEVEIALQPVLKEWVVN